MPVRMSSHILFSVSILLLLWMNIFTTGCSTASMEIQQAPSFFDYAPYATARDNVRMLQNESDASPVSHEYRICPTDVIEIKVYNYEQMDTVARVGIDGSISFPPLGFVSVVGRTPNELSVELASRLDGDYLRNPHVVVFVVESTVQSVNVMGAVHTPGLQAVWGEVRLMEVLARAGGLTPDAGHMAYITRAPANDIVTSGVVNNGHSDEINMLGYPKAVSIYLADLLLAGNMNWNVPIYPGDTVIIPPAGTVHVTGPGIAQPGTYPLSFRTTTVRQVVDEAEGLLIYARRNIQLIRKLHDLGGQVETYFVDIQRMLDDPHYDVILQPGDRLIVDVSFGRYMIYAIQAVAMKTTLRYMPTPDWYIYLGAPALYLQ